MRKNDRRHRPFLMDPQDNMIEGIIATDGGIQKTTLQLLVTKQAKDNDNDK